MKQTYKAGAKVVHISSDDIEPIKLALQKAPKTIHTLTKDVAIGDIATEDMFNPKIPAETIVGMMFIESPGSHEPLLFLVGGFLFEDMGVK